MSSPATFGWGGTTCVATFGWGGVEGAPPPPPPPPPPPSIPSVGYAGGEGLLIFPRRKKKAEEEVIDLRPLVKGKRKMEAVVVRPREPVEKEVEPEVMDLRPVLSQEQFLRAALGELEARKEEFEQGWALRMQRLNKLREAVDTELRGKEQLLLLREKKLVQDRKEVEVILLKAQQAVELSNQEIQALSNFLLALGIVVGLGIAVTALIALTIAALEMLRPK